MQLSHCKYWIFDMDGTLTIPVHDFEALRVALEIEPGTPILEAIELMPTAQAAKATQKLHRLEMDIAALGQAQPGTADTLEHLRRQGCQLGILTRNAEDIAHATLNAAGLSDFFAPGNVIGRERCAPKPDPAGIYLHLSNWQAPAAEAVMIGDYVFDLDCGRNANVTTVHFDSDGNFQWPDATDVAIRRIDELIKLAG